MNAVILHSVMQKSSFNTPHFVMSGVATKDSVNTSEELKIPKLKGILIPWESLNHRFADAFLFGFQ